MNYYFPGIIQSRRQLQGIKPLDGYTVSSGESAMVVLMRCAGIKQGDKVAIPAFVCNSLTRAITAVGGVPVYLDLKNEGTCITDYALAFITEQNCKLVILVHLYGQLHPNTQQIQAFCKQHQIFMIHDVAQSYGVNEDLFQPDFPVVYSFGPGKSTTAAGGALIKWDNQKMKNIILPEADMIQNIRAALFLSSRVYGRNKSLTEGFFEKLLDKFFPATNKICSMSKLQRKAAAYVIDKFKETCALRKQRWLLIHEACQHHPFLSNALHSAEPLSFKYVINAGSCAKAFQEYLAQHHIPFYCLGKDIMSTEKASLKNFSKMALCFFEVSCEASIPMEEIKRVAGLLAAFRN
jgi:hypothetical protein